MVIDPPSHKGVGRKSVGAAVVVLVLGIAIYSVMPRWHRIQLLRTPDGTRVATLERLYGYVDVNFRIRLDGKLIHHSWDCAPHEELPFRETLAWDTSGKILTLELCGERVFAYDMTTGTEIDPSRFPTIEVPQPTLKDIGFEGLQELRGKQSASVAE